MLKKELKSEKRQQKKKRRKHAVSGRSVFLLQKIRIKNKK